MEIKLDIDPECEECPGFEPETKVNRFWTDTKKHQEIEITCRMIEQCRWLKKITKERGQQS